jgi:uncharacterized ion transporter superfamily protein YfcC
MNELHGGPDYLGREIFIPLNIHRTVMESEQELRAMAKKIAEEKVAFHIHLVVFILVNSLLIFIWLWSGVMSFPWFLLVLGFWGIGLVAHGLCTYRGGSYTERIAEREYQRLKDRK